MSSCKIIDNTNDKKNKKIVIIGGVAAGTSAASKAKRVDPDAQITILQDEALVSYGACGMPYVIEGLIDSFEKLIERPADEFKKQYDIDVLVNTRAERINPFQQKVYAINLKNHRRISLDYDSLVIATGARPFIPPIRGVHLDGVVLLRNYGDGEKIKSLITNGADSAIIVGAGLIGLEIAESFKKNSIDNVTIVEMADNVLPNILDEDLAKIVEKHLQDKGVKLRLGEKLVEILGGEGGVGNEGSKNANGRERVRGIRTT
ncbi:MAG TPA: FAD-dependent oxidoreductase, partial [Nitrososphaeraceae archaeon]|nr:FAD-dependent oxidoreductase [Nitrososphaeraceae archaeon]